MTENIVKVVRKEKPFTCIDNGILRTNGMSSRAKALYCVICSLPADWVIRKSQMPSYFKEGRDYVFAAFDELEELGYIQRDDSRQENGRFGTSWKFYEDLSMREEPVLDNRYGTAVTVNPSLQINILTNKNNKYPLSSELRSEGNEVAKEGIKQDSVNNNLNNETKVKQTKVSLSNKTYMISEEFYNSLAEELKGYVIIKNNNYYVDDNFTNKYLNFKQEELFNEINKTLENSSSCPKNLNTELHEDNTSSETVELHEEKERESSAEEKESQGADLWSPVTPKTASQTSEEAHRSVKTKKTGKLSADSKKSALDLFLDANMTRGSDYTPDHNSPKKVKAAKKAKAPKAPKEKTIHTLIGEHYLENRAKLFDQGKVATKLASVRGPVIAQRINHFVEMGITLEQFYKVLDFQMTQEWTVEHYELQTLLSETVFMKAYTNPLCKAEEKFVPPVQRITKPCCPCCGKDLNADGKCDDCDTIDEAEVLRAKEMLERFKKNTHQ